MCYDFALQDAQLGYVNAVLTQLWFSQCKPIGSKLILAQLIWGVVWCVLRRFGEPVPLHQMPIAATFKLYFWQIKKDFYVVDGDKFPMVVVVLLHNVCPSVISQTSAVESDIVPSLSSSHLPIVVKNVKSNAYYYK